MSTCFEFANECSDPTSDTAFELSTNDLQDLVSASPIDRDQLLDRCLGNVNFALMLLEEFEKTSPSRLADLDAALTNSNLAAICSQAHGLKGVAGILAANQLMEDCANLEASANDSDMTQTCQWIQKLHEGIRQVNDFIDHFRSTL